jgi:hypothetical protein
MFRKPQRCTLVSGVIRAPGWCKYWDKKEPAAKKRRVFTAPNGNIMENPRNYGLLKAAYSVNETLEILSLGRTSLYKLINCNELHPVKLGKKTLFLAPDLTEFLVRLATNEHVAAASPFDSIDVEHTHEDNAL